jgi:hypothetical protein
MDGGTDVAITEDVIQRAREIAFLETDKYGTPPRVMLDLVEMKSVELAKKLGADTNIVRLATYLIDLKLGEAISSSRLSEHVKMSADASSDFLAQFDIDELSVGKVINCVEAHHKAVEFSCIESEIVANADCYKFIHPTGVFSYFPVLAKRNLEFYDILKQVEEKLDEKYQTLSLPAAKEELEGYYHTFKDYLALARSK